MHKNFMKKTGAAIMAAAMALNGTVISAVTSYAEGGQKYEFENGTMTETVEAVTEAGASGDKVAYMQDDGSVSVDVEVASAGMYKLTIYAYGVGGSKVQNLAINGVDQAQISIPEGEFAPISTTALLQKGENKITISKSWGWTKFDYLTVEEASLSPIKALETTPCDINATAETRSLMAYLASVYGKNIISGQQEIYSGGPHGLETEFEYLKDLTGEYPAIRGFDYGNFCCPAFGSDDGSTDRIIDWVKDKKGIATASFHYNVPKDFASYEIGQKIDWAQTTYTAKDTDFSPSKAATPGTKENEYYMQGLKTLAKEFKELEAQGIPVLWRPLHEAEGSGGESGSWFWWGREGSEAYKKLWIYTYETLTNEFDCHNLIWEWNSYNYEYSHDWYPGDAYVDIIGYDKYNCTDWSTGTAVLKHNDSAIGSTFYGIMDRYDSVKMVAMTENDSFSTVDNLLNEKAGWLYFCTWYDGGSADTNFLSNPVFNTKEDTIEMYQSEYCITLDELPADLYSKDIAPVDPSKTTTRPTTTATTTTTRPTTEADPNKDYGTVKYDKTTKNFKITLPEAAKEFYINVELPEDVTYANGGMGVSIPLDGEYYWVNLQWEAKKSGSIKVNVEDNFLNCSLGTEVVEDEALIEKIKAELGKSDTYEGQIWYAEADGEALTDKSGIQILDAYLLKGGSSSTTTPTTPVLPPTQYDGFYVDGQTIRDANGNEFEMRGVNIAHAWYKDKTEQSIKAAAELGTNCVRIVCSDGVKWDKTSKAEIEEIIGWCKENKQICILEAHDATGSNNIADIVTAAEYWATMTDLLNENAEYVILNIANEWYGEWNSATWADGCKQAIKTVRDAGIKNMIMIDCAGWGQYPTSIKEEGASVFASDPDKNTVFSMHMYEYAGGTADMVKNNIDGALKCGAPVLVGEFGLKHTDGDVDEATVMNYCEQNDMGYIAWSWMGNSGGVEYLDLVSSWDGSELTEWGEIYFDAIKNNSTLASVYTQGTVTPPTVNVSLYGDANCDGVVTIADAAAIFQAIGNADKYSLSAKGAANADCCNPGDGLTAADGLAVQKLDAKLLTSLPEKTA